MLDDETRAHCRHLQKLAESEGLNLFETLERAGLLVSVDKRIMIQKAIMAFAITQLEDQQPVVLANLGGGQTVTDTVRGCVKFLELFARGIR